MAWPIYIIWNDLQVPQLLVEVASKYRKSSFKSLFFFRKTSEPLQNDVCPSPFLFVGNIVESPIFKEIYLPYVYAATSLLSRGQGAAKNPKMALDPLSRRKMDFFRYSKPLMTVGANYHFASCSLRKCPLFMI